jgi:hypothetical protein
MATEDLVEVFRVMLERCSDDMNDVLESFAGYVRIFVFECRI